MLCLRVLVKFLREQYWCRGVAPAARLAAGARSRRQRDAQLSRIHGQRHYLLRIGRARQYETNIFASLLGNAQVVRPLRNKMDEFLVGILKGQRVWDIHIASILRLRKSLT